MFISYVCFTLVILSLYMVGWYSLFGGGFDRILSHICFRVYFHFHMKINFFRFIIFVGKIFCVFNFVPPCQLCIINQCHEYLDYCDVRWLSCKYNVKSKDAVIWIFIVLELIKGWISYGLYSMHLSTNLRCLGQQCIRIPLVTVLFKSITSGARIVYTHNWDNINKGR